MIHHRRSRPGSIRSRCVYVCCWEMLYTINRTLSGSLDRTSWSSILLFKIGPNLWFPVNVQAANDRELGINRAYTDRYCAHVFVACVQISICISRLWLLLYDMRAHTGAQPLLCGNWLTIYETLWCGIRLTVHVGRCREHIWSGVFLLVLKGKRKSFEI